MLRKVKFVLFCGFYVAAVVLCIWADRSALPKPDLGRLTSLLSGSEEGYQPLGVEFEAYRPFLPEKGTASFIMDYQFNPYVTNIEHLYTAQSYLIPLVLNPHPGELAGIIHCTNQGIANVRMRMTGYQLLIPISDGKGIAVKKQ